MDEKNKEFVQQNLDEEAKMIEEEVMCDEMLVNVRVPDELYDKITKKLDKLNNRGNQ